MRTFPIEDFVGKSMVDWPVEEFELFNCQFHDQVVEVTTPRMNVSQNIWKLHQEYDRIPLNSESMYIGNQPLSWDVLETMYSRIHEEIFRHYDPLSINREALWYKIYSNVQTNYNKYITDFKAYIRSINGFDFSEIYEHPEMVKIRKEIKPNPASIDDAYKKATDFLNNTNDLKGNPVLSDAKSNIFKMEQLLQSIVCRGYNTDIDDYIYPKPIMSCYYEGITDPLEAVMDSTLASKAYIYQGAPLEQTQYGNRKLQFTSSRMDLMVMGDCGSTMYQEVLLTKRRAKGMLGMKFLNPNTQKLDTLTRHNLDQWLKHTLPFRTVVYCGYRDKRCVCSTCYGDLALNMPYGFNMGFIGSVNTQSKVSQRVLKVKHVESLTTYEGLSLSFAEQKYIRIDPNDNAKVRFSADLRKQPVRMMIRSTETDKTINGSRLPVLTKADISPEDTTAPWSQFKEITFETMLDNDRKEVRHITVSKGSMSGYFTYEFLDWFIDQDLGISENGFYEVTLEGWDFSKPFLQLPRKHLSMKDFSASVEAFIRSTKENSARRLGNARQLTQYRDLGLAVTDLFDMIAEKVPVHYSHVSTVCASMLMPEKDDGSSRIPPLDEPAKYGRYKDVMERGSLSVMAAYQGLGTMMEQPSTYLAENREQHLFDPLWIEGRS